MEFLAILPLMLLVALAIRVTAGSMDGERIEAYARAQGWKLRRKSWRPFGPGWLGEQDARIYEIEYEDDAGRRHLAHAKTSMLSGVYITEDRVTQSAERTAEAAPPARDDAARVRELEAENAALRRRLAELERGP